MIEAPCAACGTLNRIAEADVPAGAKFVTCSSCKSRLPLPAAKTIGGAPPAPRPPAIPVPKPGKPTADLADLPAPKRTSALAGTDTPSKPAPRSALSVGDADLPAPKSASALADLPAPKAKASSALADPPAPKAKAPSAHADPPAPKTTPGIVDLPAPKSPAGLADLPAPKPTAPSAKTAPLAKPALPAKPATATIADLPAPKATGDLLDLPVPKTAVGVPEAPSRGLDLDLPAPARDIVDLPMPKPGGAGDLPAPKGFFDDLPQPALTNKPATPDLPAPKGFFDDLPQPALTNKPPAAPDLPAPKGFFDDLPQPAAPKAAAAVAPALDLDLGGPGSSPGPQLELPPDLGAPLELDRGPALPGPELELPTPSAPSSSSSFGDLDLQAPSAGIKIGAQKSPAVKPITPAPIGPPPSAGKPGKGELKLEIEGEQPQDPALSNRKPPVKKKVAPGVDPAVAAAKQRRMRRVLVAVLAVAAAGGGGFWFYQRHEKHKADAAAVEQHVNAARAALHAGDAKHWQTAAGQARAALELDGKDAAALGICGEANIAAALDTGVNGPALIAAGRKCISDAQEASRTGPDLERAQAIAPIAQKQPEIAVQKLTQLRTREPNDALLLLYLGWAQLANGDPTAAAKSFEQASAASPNVKLPALYGHGRAKRALSDLAAAKDDFAKVLAIDKDHIGAQVELAASRPASEQTQRERDLLAILGRKDIATADADAVVEAWSLAADVAMRGGRLDVARDRYNKALAITPLDVHANLGLAGVEIQDHKFQVAKDLITKAIAQAPNDPDVKLTQAKLAVAGGKLGEAKKILDELGARKPPLPPLQHSDLEMITGYLRIAQGDDDGGVEAFEQGAKEAGDLDLVPTMVAVEKLTALAKKATDNKDEAKAQAYRARASGLLAALEERAKEDESLSLTLGVAYLQAGDPAKAEVLLRAATEMAATDVEAKVELAKALTQLGRTDEALVQLQAALAADSSRADIALELASTYEAAGRTDDAAKAYAQLTAAKDVSIAARARAGRFLARTGHIDDAAAQAEPILAAEPDNAAGHYLKGEGLLKAGKLDEARRELQLATDADPDAQYLDAQGRAGEASEAATGDTKYYDLALRAYQRAADADAKMLNPQLGQARIYVAQKQWDKAIAPLQAANKLAPTDSWVMFELGVDAKNLGQPKVAIQWLEKAMAAEQRAEGYYLLGELYYDTNNPPAAARTYEKATVLGLADEKKGLNVDWLTDAYYWAGRVHMDMHDERGATRPWRLYMQHNPPANAHTDEVRSSLGTTLRNY
ncbi:MAG TPA: tetratricopeptide repeat protein [Kofleriaceae bacterium]|nr:tetratricopeptide repeat protein [Kofleriaceae bacterium]